MLELEYLIVCLYFCLKNFKNLPRYIKFLVTVYIGRHFFKIKKLK